MKKRYLIVIEMFIVALFIIISISVWVNSSNSLDINQDIILAHEEGLKLYYLNSFGYSN